ncbi:MAG: hypothetical protein IAI48_16890 [Candidatus Eremiobacteraeota bacterium]|nr:hypothetical protein [Candidatus Eremiobacteraeota bacterium]
MTIWKIAMAIAMTCALGAAEPYPRAVNFDYIDLPRTLPDLASVTTIAGSGKSGTADGPAARAEFIEPAGLAADRSGTIYVCDRYGQRVRKVDRNGNVTTLAGGGRPFGPGLAVPPGYVDGSGANARFDRPTGIAVADDGRLFVSDEGNHVIRTIKNGVVSTYAGNARKAGHVDGTRDVATFAAPTALTLDAYGNLRCGLPRPAQDRARRESEYDLDARTGRVTSIGHQRRQSRSRNRVAELLVADRRAKRSADPSTWHPRSRIPGGFGRTRGRCGLRRSLLSICRYARADRSLPYVSPH